MATDTTSFRKKLRAYTRPPRQLALTRMGKFVCLLTLSIGFGAINTGNNLMFLLFGMMMALILASGVLSEAVIRNLRAERIIPQRVTAGLPARGHYILHNEKSNAALSIEVSDRMARVIDGPNTGKLLGRKTARWWQFWKPTHIGDAFASTYWARIEGDSKDQKPTTFVFPKRGRYRLGRLVIDTRFPFSMFEKSRKTRTDSDVVVHPEAIETVEWMRHLSQGNGEDPSDIQGNGTDFFGLNEYREGDDARKIHWKSSAKRLRPVIRETEKEVDTAVHVTFVNVAPSLIPAAFETAVSKTAGLLISLSDRGVPTAFSMSGAHVPAGVGRGHVDQILDLLAVVSPVATFEDVSPESSRMATVAVTTSTSNLPKTFDHVFSVDA